MLSNFIISSFVFIFISHYIFYRMLGLLGIVVVIVVSSILPIRYAYISFALSHYIPQPLYRVGHVEWGFRLRLCSLHL